jgi:hypothetical protein
VHFYAPYFFAIFLKYIWWIQNNMFNIVQTNDFKPKKRIMKKEKNQLIFLLVAALYFVVRAFI